MRLGVAFGWHSFAWEELAALVERAEALGYAAAYVDGDVSMLGVRRDADVLDGWTVTTALIARTRRIPIGSLRLVEHWNAARSTTTQQPGHAGGQLMARREQARAIQEVLL